MGTGGSLGPPAGVEGAAGTALGVTGASIGNDSCALSSLTVSLFLLAAAGLDAVGASCLSADWVVVGVVFAAAVSFFPASGKSSSIGSCLMAVVAIADAGVVVIVVCVVSRAVAAGTGFDVAAAAALSSLDDSSLSSCGASL